MRLQRFLTVEEVSRRYRVDPGDIRREIAAGRLGAVNLGSSTRIPRRALREFEIALGLRRPGPRFHRLAFAAACLMFAGLLSGSDLVDPDLKWGHTSIDPQRTLFTGPEVTGDADHWFIIDAPLDYRLYNDVPNPEPEPGLTQMLMSLQHRNEVEPGTFSFPWTMFVNLETNHELGDGVGTYVLLHNRGSGWATGYHVDSYAWSSGTTIGANIETLDVGGNNPYLLGLNVQNKGFSGNVGMQVQTGPLPNAHPLWQEGMDGGWEVGLRFQGMPGFGRFDTGIELDQHTWGNRGIWIRGDYQTGIDLGHNDLAMRAGARVRLADDAGIALRFNAERDRIEFIQGDEVIGYLDAGLRNADLGR